MQLTKIKIKFSRTKLKQEGVHHRALRDFTAQGEGSLEAPTQT